MIKNNLESKILEWVEEHVRSNSGSSLEIGPETNLMATGTLDSVGFLELIAYLEESLDVTIDLTRIEELHLTSIRSMSLQLQTAADSRI